MATKEAHNKASVEYNRRQDNIMIRPPKEMGAKIREAAAAENMSVQGYILQTLYAKIDITPGGVVKNPESVPLTTEKPSCTISPSLEKSIKKCIQTAMESFPDGEYNQLKSELNRLIEETIEEEERKLKADATKKEEPEPDKPRKPFTCESLL